MKSSSLTLNLVIIVACNLIFFTNVLRLLVYGAGKYDIGDTTSSALCQVRLLSRDNQKPIKSIHIQIYKGLQTQ